MNKRIVIANSVGIDSNGWAIIHSPSRWTNSTKEQDVFTYYPWELAYTSSLLKRETDHDVEFIDGCLEKFTVERFFDRISQAPPDFLLMEPSTRTWHDDWKLMEKVQKAFGTKIIAAGQHATAFPEKVAQCADYVLIGEYEYAVLDIMHGKERRDILGLYPNPRRPLLDITKLPWPEDNNVERIRYGIPGEPSSEYLEVQAYASRGCPMNCNFCVCRHLYYHTANWRPRNQEDVVAEMRYLKNKYPRMEGIFFDEECHNIKKKFILDLCKTIVQNNLHNLKIEAMCAYVTLDEEMMHAMKDAGYYLLRVGIETAGKGAAAGIGLGAKFNLEKLRKTLHLAKKIGLKMYGTFTFGAPGSSKKDDQATLHLMEETIGDGLLWKFQTSICTPQPGTPFYEWAQQKNLLKTYVPQEYDGGNRVVVEYPDYSSEEIMKTYLSSQKYFDVALKNRFSLKIDESIKMLQPLSLQKILVLRTSRMLQVEVALRALKKRLPHCVIDVLGQPAVYDALMRLRKEAVIDTIYLYDKGFFLQKELSEELRDTIRTQKYNMACIIYSNVKGQGFENVEAFLESLHMDKWIAFNAAGDILKQTDMRKIRNEKYVSCAQ